MPEGEKTKERQTEEQKCKECFDNLTFESDLGSRLSNYINYVKSQTDRYEDRRKIFLEMNLTIIILLVSLLSVMIRIYESSNNIGVQKWAWILLFTFFIYIIFTLFNIIYNLIEHATEIKKPTSKWQKLTAFFTKKFDIFIKAICNIKYINSKDNDRKVIWFYRGHGLGKKWTWKGLYDYAKEYFYGEKEEQPVNSKLIRDDIKSLYQLYFFQRNYYKLSIGTRKITVYGLFYSSIVFIATLIIYTMPGWVKF